MKKLRVARRYGDELACECPKCGDPTHLWYNVKSGLANCFKCSYSFKDTRVRLVGDEGQTSLPKSHLPHLLSKDFQPSTLPPAKTTNQLLVYCKRRGIPRSTVERFGIGYCDQGRFRGRVVVPVKEDGRVVGWVGRSLDDRKLKYLYPKGFKAKQFLFNLGEQKEVVLVEGVFDVLRHPNSCVGLFGKTATLTQISKLVRKGPAKVVVFLDPDAKKEAVTLCHLCFPYLRTYLVENHLEDPGDMPEEEFRWYVRGAREVNHKNFLNQRIRYG